MTDWVLRLIDAGGYWGIGLLMVLENVFPPIPSELIMGIGGIRVGQGRMAMEWLLLAGTVGTTLGNYFWYLVGHILGFHRLKPLVDRYGRWATLEWRDVEALDRLFGKYGQIVVFVFRFLPAFRTMVSLPAGPADRARAGQQRAASGPGRNQAVRQCEGQCACRKRGLRQRHRVATRHGGDQAPFLGA